MVCSKQALTRTQEGKNNNLGGRRNSGTNYSAGDKIPRPCPWATTDQGVARVPSLLGL